MVVMVIVMGRDTDGNGGDGSGGGAWRRWAQSSVVMLVSNLYGSWPWRTQSINDDERETAGRRAEKVARVMVMMMKVQRAGGY